MLGNAVSPLLQHVRRLAAAASSDEQLLADFLSRRSDEAFAALLGRHGPMVLNVCRRILHDDHAAEDVFQATFLVLAGRAAAIRRPASLAGFLHGVAYRLAIRARRQRVQSLPAAVDDKAVAPPEELAWKEMLGILDDELGQLSDQYRAPLVLCYLEGRTQDQAARQLGLCLNTLRRRLAKGRRLLEARLRGRGVTLSAALAGLLAANAVAVPGPLRAATLAAVGARALEGWTAGAAVLSSAWKGMTLILSTSGKKVGALVVVAALASAVCFAYCLAHHAEQPPAASAPPPAASAAGADQDDPAADPLPAQAAVRLGTARYRHGSRIGSFAVSADGRLAAAASGMHSFSPARVFDLTNGRCLYSLPNEPQTTIEAVGLSPDGKTLAVKDGKFLYFQEAATGKEIRKIKYLPDSGGGRSVTNWLTFTPDGKQVAATLMGDTICLIDVGTGEVIRTFASVVPAAGCAFSPDGKLMTTRGYDVANNKVNFAQLWEVATGKKLRRFAISHDIQQSISALAFSPDGTTIASGSWRDARLRLWETATGKQLKTFPKIGAGIVSVAFAPDGKTVAAAGDIIYLYDPATGKERRRIERRAQGLAFSRDGAVLTGAVSGAIYRWDAASGRQLAPAAAQDSGVEQILVAAGGRRLFTIDQDGGLYAWDTSGGKPPRRIAGEVGLGAVASPDGRFLAWHAQDDGWIRLYDIAAERFRDHFPIPAGDANVEAVLPDGKTLLTVDDSSSMVRWWDIPSRKERRSFAAYPKAEPNQRLVWGFPYANRRAALSPDGKTLAIGPVDDRNLPVGLWDVATGKVRHKLDVRLPSVNDAFEEALGVELGHLAKHRINGYMSSGNGLTFSPDGRLVVTWSENPCAPSPEDHVAVWDAATGRIVTKLSTDRAIGAGSVAFAADGRTLATASADGTIRLWEMATWKVRAQLRGHRDRITALAFSPDGRLFSGGLDTVVLGWDVRPPRGPAKGTLADAWETLANSDAKAGFSAQGRFLAEPAKAVEWFAARLTPAAGLDPSRVKALIADLDSNNFATRERATADLKEHWPTTAAALREATAKPTSLEARRRAEGIIQDMEHGVTPSQLRTLRAAEVLEWIATKEARARLLELAKGAPDAHLTREAAAACKRLEGRK